MAKTTVHHGNKIAAGYNNYSGLTNIELISVGGNTPQDYLLPVQDLGLWADGVERFGGDGIAKDDGYATTSWECAALSFSQWYYLYTTVLGGNRSGKVTIRTRRWHVPLNSTMSYSYVIANAILTLPPPPDTSRGVYVAGYEPFVYSFTRVQVIHEDKMYGEIYVKDGSTAQENIDTTAVKLTGFASDGLSDGVTASNSDDSLTCIIAGKYQATFTASFTSTASTKWTFAFAVDGTIGNFQTIAETNATPDAVNVSLSGILSLAANEVVTVYVKSDDGGGTADITITDAQLSMVSINTVNS